MDTIITVRDLKILLSAYRDDATIQAVKLKDLPADLAKKTGAKQAVIPYNISAVRSDVLLCSDEYVEEPEEAVVTLILTPLFDNQFDER